jgi:hypothetical protein
MISGSGRNANRKDNAVRLTLRPLGIVAILLGVFFGAMVGCGTKKGPAVDVEPFKKAIAEYLQRNNMAMALKEVKEGPTVQDKTATLTASLTHAQLGGPAVTWQIRFEQNPDGSWKAVGHK